MKRVKIIIFFLRVPLWYYPFTFCFFGKDFQTASWKTSFKDHFRHLKMTSIYFVICNLGFVCNLYFVICNFKASPTFLVAACRPV